LFTTLEVRTLLANLRATRPRLLLGFGARSLCRCKQLLRLGAKYLNLRLGLPLCSRLTLTTIYLVSESCPRGGPGRGSWLARPSLRDARVVLIGASAVVLIGASGVASASSHD
jgi:hypothetical protein